MSIVNIPFLGIDTQVLNTESPDGLCSQIQNLKPKGTEARPYWTVAETINNLENSSQTPFTYTHGIDSIKSVFWQIRNQVNESFQSTASTSLRRLLVLCEKVDRCAIDIVDPVDWSIVKSLDLPLDTGYEFTATRLRQMTVINVTKDKTPFKLYYLLDDLFVEQGWPELPEVFSDTFQQTFSQSDVDAGNVIGVTRATKTYFKTRWAYRLFDGTYVKHSDFKVFTVFDGDAVDHVIPRFTVVGHETPIENQVFWETQIAGITFFATQPKDTYQDALDDGVFYAIADFSGVDRIPEADWVSGQNPNVVSTELSAEAWPTQDVLNIDSFSHHKAAARVIDSYNERLLIGGEQIDFHIPKINIGGTGGGTGTQFADFFVLDNDNYQESFTYYDNLGVSQPEGDPSVDYFVRVFQARAEFRPVKPGHEIKAITVLFEGAPTLTELGPHGGNEVPLVQYTVSQQGENIRIQIDQEDSDGYGQQGFLGTVQVQVDLGPTTGGTEDVITFFATPGAPASGEILNPGVPDGGAIEISSFNIPGGAPVDYDVLQEITIVTEEGIFKRVGSFQVTTNATTITIPELLSYPDRRATNIKLIFKNGTDYEVIMDKSLKAHPANNLSYVFLTQAEQTYTIGSGAATTAPDLTVNDKKSFIRNIVKASLTNQPLVFDAAASYRIGQKHNDEVQGFAVNQIDISSGQFGQYPLYALSNNSIWALEQTGDPLIAFGRIVPIDTRNGLSSPEAMCNVERAVIIADERNIFSLTGQQTERIDRAISLDPDYDAFLDGIKLAYHQTDDYEELICSNPAFSYSWHFNLRYRVWYKNTDVFRLFFIDQSNIYGITTGEEVKDFSNFSTNVPKAWELTTRPLNFGDYNIRKKLRRSNVRSTFVQPNQGNPADYLPLRLIVEAEKHTGTFEISNNEYKAESLTDIPFRSKYGSYKAFIFKLTGTNTPDGTLINDLELNFDPRYTERVRV